MARHSVDGGGRAGGSASEDAIDSVRILLADSQSLFCDALRAVLEREPDLAVVGEARNGPEALALVERSQPDIVLLDAELADNGLGHACTTILEHSSRTRVLVLTSKESPDELIEALEGEASGYLTKECPISELIDAMRAVNRGQTLIPSNMIGELVARLFRRKRKQGGALQRVSRLTPREKAVLALLADGADNETIARTLVISPETARTHIQNILTKLGVHSRLEAAVFVRQNGILDELVTAQ